MVMDWVQLAETAADAEGENFFIGVRPMGKGWFAHCNGVEWDGDTPEMAVRSVIQSLQRQASTNAANLDQQAKAAKALLANLTQIENS